MLKNWNEWKTIGTDKEVFSWGSWQTYEDKLDYKRRIMKDDVNKAVKWMNHICPTYLFNIQFEYEPGKEYVSISPTYAHVMAHVVAASINNTLGVELINIEQLWKCEDLAKWNTNKFDLTSLETYASSLVQWCYENSANYLVNVLNSSCDKVVESYNNIANVVNGEELNYYNIISNYYRESGDDIIAKSIYLPYDSMLLDDPVIKRFYKDIKEYILHVSKSTQFDELMYNWLDREIHRYKYTDEEICETLCNGKYIYAKYSLYNLIKENFEKMFKNSLSMLLETAMQYIVYLATTGKDNVEHGLPPEPIELVKRVNSVQDDATPDPSIMQQPQQEIQNQGIYQQPAMMYNPYMMMFNPYMMYPQPMMDNPTIETPDGEVKVNVQAGMASIPLVQPQYTPDQINQFQNNLFGNGLYYNPNQMYLQTNFGPEIADMINNINANIYQNPAIADVPDHVRGVEIPEEKEDIKEEKLKKEEKPKKKPKIRNPFKKEEQQPVLSTTDNTDDKKPEVIQLVSRIIPDDDKKLNDEKDSKAIPINNFNIPTGPYSMEFIDKTISEALDHCDNKYTSRISKPVVTDNKNSNENKKDKNKKKKSGGKKYDKVHK